MITLSGLICLRNGESLDYCWREAVQSMLPVCDEIVICEGESTDDTVKVVREWMEREPKLKLCIYRWPNPKGDIDFYVNWIQYGRHHTRGEFLFHNDADEVIDEASQEVLAKFKQDAKPGERVSLKGHRYNFWRDAKSLIPHNVCLSHIVTRIAPRYIFMPSDGPHPQAGPIQTMAKSSQITFFHYGFLRKPEAYFKKSRELHAAFFNSYDPRLAEAEDKGQKWMEEIKDVEWRDQLLPFTGQHPEVIKPWLRARGYDC